MINNIKIRGIVIQLVAVGTVVFILVLMGYTMMDNRSATGVTTGFSFLHSEAGFAIGETMIPYELGDSYGRALVNGILNTLRVAVAGIVLSTLLGSIIGVLRLSKNFFIKKITAIYVEVFRNIPVLVQLFFWYGLIKFAMPHPRDAINPFGDVFLCNRGMIIPTIVSDGSFWTVAVAFMVGLTALSLVWRRFRKRQGKLGSNGIRVCAAIFFTTIIVMILAADPLSIQIEVPVLKGFNFKNGLVMSPEFTAMLVGLTIYTSAFIAEIVRAGILSVNSGQIEASLSLGLSKTQILRLVIMPQAFRVMIPPTTSQYLNLTKNSSLAVAIGYPDLVNIGNTTINQTGQSVEVILVFMGVYLSISLIISLFMNWYNKKIALVSG